MKSSFRERFDNLKECFMMVCAVKSGHSGIANLQYVEDFLKELIDSAITGSKAELVLKLSQEQIDYLLRQEVITVNDGNKLVKELINMGIFDEKKDEKNR